MSSSQGAATLSIGTVATQAHVSVAVLRAWERRYGFPIPARVPSGHRRYSANQVEQVREVLRDRDAGWSLEAAIDRQRGPDRRVERSIFAGLGRMHPDLPVHELPRRSMLAISHAIEDEYCARAERPVLIGAFERMRFFEQSAARWNELARTAAITVVFADFPKSRVRPNVPIEVALKSDAPLLREWAVVCDAPEGAACVTGIERPGRRPGEPGRTFDALWSFDPHVVRDATEIGLALARQHAPRIGHTLDRVEPRGAVNSGTALRRAASLTNRVVAYLDH